MKEDTISRVTRTRQEARASYDRLSSWYDLLAGSAEKKFKQAGLHKLNIQPGEKVLEIGFGTGDGLLALAKSVNASGKVYGLDLSEGMARVAQLKLKKAGLLDRVELLCGDAAALPYERNSLDAIFSSFTLELFDTPEIPMVLNQCHNVLLPNGRICLVVMVKKQESNRMVKLYEWAHEKFPRWIDCRPIDAQKALEETGFNIKNVVQQSMYGLPVEIILAEKEKDDSS